MQLVLEKLVSPNKMVMEMVPASNPAIKVVRNTNVIVDKS